MKLALTLACALGSNLSGLAQTAAPMAGSTEADLPRASRATEDDFVVLDTYEITGSFAGSLAAAAEAKKEAPMVVEVITAEDIGKLPDTSIAESLARLPGLTTQRVNSRAQGIVIRGLTGDFSTGLLNGREQVSSGSGRSVEFDQYPAELLSGVVVYKTADAALVGQGLAGTIDLRTVRPLDHGRRDFLVKATYEWTSQGALNPDSEEYGLSATASYIDQFMDGKLGVAFGYAHTEKPGQGEQWNAWGYPTIDVDGEQTFIIGGAKPFVRSSMLERDGYMGAIQFKPTDSFNTTVDVYMSDFAEEQILRGIEFPFQWGPSPADNLRPGYTVEDGLVTESTWDNVFGVMRNDLVMRDTDVLAIGWNMEFGDREGWLFSTDISYSEIEREDFVLETYSGYGSNLVGTPDTMNVSMRSDRGARFTPTLDYADAGAIRLTSPQGWGNGVVPGGQVGFLKGPRAEDDLTQYRFAADRALDGFFSKLKFGAAYTERNKSEVEAGPNGMEGYFLALPGGQTSAPLPTLMRNTSLSFIGIPAMISYDPLELLRNGTYDLVANDNPAYVANNWDVKEKITLGYVQMNMATEIGGVPMTGNIGLQYMLTDQSSSGLAASGTLITPVSESHDYDDFLPSLNLRFELAEGKYLRLSLARQLARQTMYDMRAGSTYGFNEGLAEETDPTASPWSGSGGNPKLEPWRSNSVDLVYENYFADDMGYWALGAYYKDLVSYTYNENILTDFTGYPPGTYTGPIGTYLGYRTVPNNGNGGHIYGFEGTLSLPGEKFSQSLKGWGVILSATFIESSIEPDTSNPKTPIPGLSEEVINATLYYERGGFSARLSGRYRSDYRGDIATFGPRGAVYRNLQEETVVDAQISYAFREGPLKGVTVLVTGSNLTDEPLFATQGDDVRLVQDYQSYGANYSVGVSYRF